MLRKAQWLGGDTTMISTPIALFASLMLVCLAGVALYIAIISLLGNKSNTRRLDVLEDSHEELRLSHEQMQAILQEIPEQ